MGGTPCGPGPLPQGLVFPPAEPPVCSISGRAWGKQAAVCSAVRSGGGTGHQVLIKTRSSTSCHATVSMSMRAGPYCSQEDSGGGSGDSHAAHEPTGSSPGAAVCPVPDAGQDQVRALLLAAVEEIRSAADSGGRQGGGKRPQATAAATAFSPHGGSETARRQLLAHLAGGLHGTQLDRSPALPHEVTSASHIAGLRGTQLHLSSAQPQGLAASASQLGGKAATVLLPISKWVVLLRGLTRGGEASMIAEASCGRVRYVPGGDGGTDALLCLAPEGGGWVSACDVLIETMQTDTELQLRRGGGSGGSSGGRGGRGSGSWRADDEGVAVEHLAKLIVAASGLLRIRFQAGKKELLGSRGTDRLGASHSTSKAPSSSWGGIPSRHHVSPRPQHQSDHLLLQRRAPQRRWMQLALSSLRPHLHLLRPPTLLALLRCLAAGEGHPAGLPLQPDPAWMRKLYSCTADVHMPPAAASLQAAPSSEAPPSGADSCAASVIVQPPPAGGTTISRCHMGLMNSMQLEQLEWVLSKLGQGQPPPNEWKQVGFRVLDLCFGV